MATLADVKRYFEAGKHGRKVSISEEIRALTPADREELCAELDKLTEEERKQ